MPQGIYLPEGHLLENEQNRACLATEEGLLEARRDGVTLEGMATMCDERRDLHVRLGAFRGRIPREEAGLGADRGNLREIAILSRVGKPVCFKVIGREGETFVLSRRLAQQEASEHFRDHLHPGEVIRATVTHLEQFGAFVDMGRGLVSMIGIENISVSRISHANQRFTPGQTVLAAVLRKEAGGRICLTHRELLGTWMENAGRIRAGTALRGIVRSVEPYGVFVELAPNLSGLAEPCEGVRPGMLASVFVKSVLPDRMKIKLSILDVLPGEGKRLIEDKDYWIREGRLSRWQYQPETCLRHCVETVFG